MNWPLIIGIVGAGVFIVACVVGAFFYALRAVGREIDEERGNITSNEK